MLRFLRVRRLAVIDSVEVEFEPGLNVLTGETGAGKSILVEAVGLLLGGRASGDLVRTGEEAACIEAIFESGGEELLVRREITQQGRSRAFVNGELTTAGALKDLASRLIELHGQHEHQTLLDPSTHLGMLDAFAGLDSLAQPVAGAFGSFRQAAEELASARRALLDRTARQDLAEFQLAELEKAALKPGEDEELFASKQILANAERVQRLCEEAYTSLYEADDAVLAALGGVWRRVSELAALDPQFQPYLEQREAIKSQLDDLAVFLRRYADSIEASPARLQQVEDRLAVLERIKRKYGPTVPDAIAKREGLRQELDNLGHGEERVNVLERQYQSARNGYLAAATVLSRARRDAAATFGRSLERTLVDLAMERTRFEVKFGEPLSEDAWSAQGIDQAEFWLSPNIGEELRPLIRIASGGELSRIMLALKTQTAASRHGFTNADRRDPSASTPGLIFDEVDAGIGGRVADVVGRKLRVLGSAFQVLCITHLAQIAAYADSHFLIQKRVEKGRTITRVGKLSEAARVEEIGRMLGGAVVTDAIRASAREMLAQRQGQAKAKGEMKPKGESESRARRAPR
jgi:DNA repair protein RecN (Recombination protein N)